MRLEAVLETMDEDGGGGGGGMDASAKDEEISNIVRL